MRNITKFKRSIRAISPVISVLLMIAVAVVASLVAYAWVMGYMNFSLDKTGKSIQIPSYAQGATDTQMLIYVQNTGQGTVEVGNIYINDVQATITDPADKTLPEGQTKQFTITLANGATWTPGQQVNIKVVTTSGTSMTVKGTGTSSSSPAPTHGAATSITVSPNPATVVSGATETFTAMASDGSNSWDVSTSAAWSVNPTSAGTFSGNVFTATTAGTSYTVTATFSSVSGTAPLTVTAGTITSITVSPDSASIASGSTQTYTAMASDGTNSWDVSTSATWTVNPTAGGTFAGNVLTAGAVGNSYTVKAEYSGVSDTASLSVTPAVATKLVFSVHPSPIIAGVNTLFTIERQTAAGNPTTNGGDITINLDDGGVNYANFYAHEGDTNAIFSITLPAGSSSVNVYYGYWTGNPLPATVTFTATSTGLTQAQTTVTVNKALTAPTITASRTTIDRSQHQSSTLSCSVATSGGTTPYTYQWYQDTPSSGTNFVAISGATSDSYTFSSSGTTDGTYSFRLVVTDNAGATVTSNTITVTSQA